MYAMFYMNKKHVVARNKQHVVVFIVGRYCFIGGGDIKKNMEKKKKKRRV